MCVCGGGGLWLCVCVVPGCLCGESVCGCVGVVLV